MPSICHIYINQYPYPYVCYIRDKLAWYKMLSKGICVKQELIYIRFVVYLNSRVREGECECPMCWLTPKNHSCHD